MQRRATLTSAVLSGTNTYADRLGAHAPVLPCVFLPLLLLPPGQLHGPQRHPP